MIFRSWIFRPITSSVLGHSSVFIYFAAAQILVLIQYSVQLELIHRLEAKPVYPAHRVPNV